MLDKLQNIWLVIGLFTLALNVFMNNWCNNPSICNQHNSAIVGYSLIVITIGAIGMLLVNGLSHLYAGHFPAKMAPPEKDAFVVKGYEHFRLVIKELNDDLASKAPERFEEMMLYMPNIDFDFDMKTVANIDGRFAMLHEYPNELKFLVLHVLGHHIYCTSSEKIANRYAKKVLKEIGTPIVEKYGCNTPVPPEMQDALAKAKKRFVTRVVISSRMTQVSRKGTNISSRSKKRNPEIGLSEYIGKSVVEFGNGMIIDEQDVNKLSAPENRERLEALTVEVNKKLRMQGVSELTTNEFIMALKAMVGDNAESRS